MEAIDWSKETHKVVVSFGKFKFPPFYKTRSCEVEVEIGWWYHPGNEESYFSVRGAIWNHIKSDIYQGGQCYDTLAKMLHSRIFSNLILPLWKKYHLKVWSSLTPEERLEIQDALVFLEARNAVKARGML